IQYLLMRKPVIAGNWKMYKTVAESVATAISLRPLIANSQYCEVIIAPVFTALKTVVDRLEGSNICVAAQNCSTETKYGALTGEIAASMLADIGVTHVIIGHSERRQYFGETDAAINKKIAAALEAGLIPIVCIGETLEERDSRREEEVVTHQLIAGLSGLTASDLTRMMLAYEPVWAIGTGRTATPEQAQAMHGFIRHVLVERYGHTSAEGFRILYGGSVKPDNISGLMNQPDIDGALVGGASLEAEAFARIVNYNRQ
ncbi:MAG: triose-phosphate isomerase, partial [Pyrinomonadaceae bacterium]